MSAGPGPADYRGRAVAADAVAVASASLLLGLLLAQETFYGVDGWRFARRLAADGLQSELHPLFRPVAWSLIQVLEGLGLRFTTAFTATSAVGTAVGVGLFHAAWATLLRGRRAAWIASGLFATAPGVVFYATVIEIHGVFLAFAGLAAWAGVRFAVVPSAGRAAIAAATVALAYGAHSTGILMLTLLLPLAWRRGVGLPRLAAVAAGAALGLVAVRLLAWGSGLSPGGGSNVRFLLVHATENFVRRDVGEFALAAVRCTWNEMLLPFLPASVVALAAAGCDPSQRAPRGLRTAVLVGGVVYLAFAFVILGDFDERGAYLLPWGAFACASSGAWLARAHPALPLAALALSLGLGLTRVALHDTRPTAPVAAELRALGAASPSGRPPFLILAERPGFELLFAEFPEYEQPRDWYDALDGSTAPLDELPPAQRERLLRVLVGLLRRTAAGGRLLWMPAVAVEHLRHPEKDDFAAGPVLLERLERAFVFEPHAAAGFDGFLLRPRG